MVVYIYIGGVAVKSQIKLRPYQQDCVDAIASHFEKNDKQLIQIPTGGGKTFIFLHYLKFASVKTLIVVPTIELLEQVLHWGKIILNDREVLSYKDRKDADVIVTTTAALRYSSNQTLFGKFDHLVIDEAHHIYAKNYLEFMDKQTHKYKLLGCTATPERMDGKNLLKIFDSLTFDMNLLDLIKLEELCDIEATRVKTNISLTGHIRKGGDIVPKKLKELDNVSRNRLIIKTFKDECPDKKTLIFCVNIEHAISLSGMMNKKGISSEYIYGDMSSSKRKRILADFKKGKIQVLTNCQLLTEGFDEPSIEALIIARPTMSKTLYCQMVGRGVRKHPGKEVCELYELTDNIHDICTFNTLAIPDKFYEGDYTPRKRLTHYAKELESLDIQSIDIEKVKFNLFKPEEVLSESRYETAFKNVTMPTTKKRFINRLPYKNDLNPLELSFLIWKEKIKEKYGYNRK